MIKVGDKVKFLNDVGGGIVTGFVGKNMVNVENEDGFEIPCPIRELVNVDAPELVEEPQKVGQPGRENAEVIPSVKEGEIVAGKDEAEFYFCFVPENNAQPAKDAIHLYLVNDSNYTVLYRYSHHEEKAVQTVKYGNLHAHGRILLESIGGNDLNDLPDYGFQLLYFKDEETEWQSSIRKTFRLNPVKFHKSSSFVSSPYFSNNALVLKIAPQVSDEELDKMTQEDFKKLIKEKEKKEVPKRQERKRTPEIVEVDLHISALLDDYSGLSNRDILGLQMDKVESEMNDALQKGVKRIVFIHGVGQGVLKQEVARLLKQKFRKYNFQDASFQEYGYGATMVRLRR